MKKNALLLAISIVAILFPGCQKEGLVKEQSLLLDKMKAVQGNSNIPNGEENAYKMASLLQKAISKGDNSFLELLQKESVKKFDGDYDVLVAVSFAKKETKSSSDLEDLRTSLLNSFSTSPMRSSEDGNFKLYVDNLIDSISKTEPLLNIYMPDWEDLSQYDDFLVVIQPKNADDTKGYKLTAYNRKGETIILDSKTEPNVPYLVVGYNERTNIGNHNASTSHAVLQTKYHSYSLKKNYISLSQDTSIEQSNNTTRATRKRSILDRESVEKIKMARFTSKKALQNVETWSRGQPEMFCKVYYKKLGSLLDFIVGEVSVHDINLGEDGWYSGSRSWLKFRPWRVIENHGNWHVFRWVPTALMTKVSYLFYEDDGGVSVTVSAFGKEVKATVSNGDLVGSSWVFFADELGRTYKISNNFEFIIDQQK